MYLNLLLPITDIISQVNPPLDKASFLLGTNDASQPFSVSKREVPAGTVYGLRLEATALQGDEVYTWENGVPATFANWAEGEPVSLFENKVGIHPRDSSSNELHCILFFQIHCVQHVLADMPQRGYWHLRPCLEYGYVFCSLEKQANGIVSSILLTIGVSQN